MSFSHFRAPIKTSRQRRFSFFIFRTNTKHLDSGSHLSFSETQVQLTHLPHLPNVSAKFA